MNMALKPPLLVTAAIIRSRGKVLLARRPLDGRVEAGKWEFPGGKVESGEHPEASLAREIREELGLDIVIDQYFGHVAHVYAGEPATSIVLLCYVCRIESGEARPIEAAEIRWVTREELRSFEFAAADEPLVERLAREWDL